MAINKHIFECAVEKKMILEEIKDKGSYFLCFIGWIVDS